MACKEPSRASMAFNAVAMFTLAAVAKPFVLTIFGPQWEPSIPLLQVLCLVTLMTPLHVLNLQALMAIGRSDLFFILELIKKAIGIGILVLVSSYGGIGIAWGLVVAGLISFIVNSWYSGRLFNYGASSPSNPNCSFSVARNNRSRSRDFRDGGQRDRC